MGLAEGFAVGQQIILARERALRDEEMQKERIKLLRQRLSGQEANRQLRERELASELQQMQQQVLQSQALSRAFTFGGFGQQQRLQTLPQSAQTTPFDPTQVRQQAQRQAIGEAIAAGVPLEQAFQAARGITSQEEAFTLSPGQTRFRGGQAIASVPAEQREARTPFQALTQAGMDPFNAFSRLETERARIRAEHQRQIRVLSPEGTEISIGPPSATGEIRPLTGAQQLGVVNQAENIRRSLESIHDLRTIVEGDPNAFGVAANIRQTVSSAITEGVRGFQVLMERNEQALGALPIEGAEAQRLARTLVNPETSRADYLFETLVFELARALNNQGRLSDADVRAARRVLSGRIRSTDDLLPRLGQMIKQLTRDHASLQRRARSFRFDVAPLPEALITMPRERQQPTETPVRDDLQNMTDDELKRQLGIE